MVPRPEPRRHRPLWPELDVRPQDEIIEKYRFSGFLPGTSELPDRLRTRGFDTVLITGTVTNVCCESSDQLLAQAGQRPRCAAFGIASVSDHVSEADPANGAASMRSSFLTPRWRKADSNR
jgi:nicotinamidase-related amidase